MADVYFIRTRKERNFTAIDNTVLKDKELSWKAKGFFVYLLSLPDDWKIYLSDLRNRSTDGETSIRSTIKELTKHGYIKQERVKDDKGRWTSYRYEIIENPHVEKPNVDNPIVEKSNVENLIVEKSNVENLIVENQSLLNTNSTKYLIKPNTNTNNTNTTTMEAQENKKITSSMFEKFWLLYPRKINKGLAKTKWEKICNKPVKERPTWKEIESAIAVQIKTKWYGIDAQYIPHPTTWLNNQRWLDDPTEEEKNEVLSSTILDKPTQSPRKIIHLHFKDSILSRAFYKDCYQPAKDLFPPDFDLDTNKLARQLVTFHSQIEKEQDKNFNHDLNLIRLFPGPVELVQHYIEWITSTPWVHNMRISMFDIHSGLFTNFRQEEAKRDNLERDPLTGHSYMRG